MKKINLRGITEILSEKEMKNVLGGSGSGSGTGSGGGTDLNVNSEPCKNSGCKGPNGAAVIGGLCCLLPCNGIFGTYGYGIVSGVSRCPYV